MSTPAEKRHLGRIARMQCICCRLMGAAQGFPTEVHHLREAREERNHWLTIPLCGEGCHRGPRGVHGDKSYLRLLKMSEFGLLAETIAELQAATLAEFETALASVLLAALSPGSPRQQSRGRTRAAGSG